MRPPGGRAHPNGPRASDGIVASAGRRGRQHGPDAPRARASPTSARAIRTTLRNGSARRSRGRYGAERRDETHGAPGVSEAPWVRIEPATGLRAVLRTRARIVERHEV